MNLQYGYVIILLGLYNCIVLYHVFSILDYIDCINNDVIGYPAISVAISVS